MRRDAGAPDGAQGRAVLNLLGLAARAQATVTGTDAVRQAARAGGVEYVLLAADAAEGQRGKLTPLLTAAGIPYHTRFTRAELGHAMGRAPVAAVAVTNEQFARRVRQMVAALPSLQD